MYFYLNCNCILVCGGKKSAIYDFFTNKLYGIDSESTQLLIKSEKGEPIDDYYDVNSIFKDLEKADLGFVSDNKCFVDKLRATDAMTVKRTDINHPKVLHAYIRLTNKCNNKCKPCNKMFCPICLCTDEEASNTELDYSNWINIIDRLCKTGLEEITFTGGDPLLYKDLKKLIDYTLSKKISIDIVTPGIENIPNNLSREANILIPLFEKRDINNIVEKFKDFKNVKIKCIDNNIEEEVRNLGYNNILVEETTFEEHTITKNDLVSFDLFTYSGKKYFDTCLLGKIFINYDGNIVPCFNDIDNVLGSATLSEFNYSMRTLVRDYWHEKNLNLKCRLCEYIYVCSSCRYTNYEKCKYNPSEGIWQE